MIELAIMIEGQDGLNWPRWQRLAVAVEQLGFAGLFRSDHFTNASGPHKDALELWASLAWLASHTQRIEFGPLVSPVSFRHPVITAWTAAAVDDLSGGRLRLGLGAGWQEREHRAYGFDLLDLDARFRRLEEALEVVTRLLRSDTPVDFAGEFYRLDDALLLPRPQRPGGPPIVIGGNGVKRTLRLAARYADEWNAVLVPVERFRELNQTLDRYLDKMGRPRQAVRRTLMTRVVIGKSESEARQKLGIDLETARQRGVIVGTPDAIVEQIGRLEEAGVSRLQAQWLDMDDMDGLDLLATRVMAQLVA